MRDLEGMWSLKEVGPSPKSNRELGKGLTQGRSTSGCMVDKYVWLYCG